MDGSFDVLFSREVGYVHRTLLRLGVSARDVEDGVQEVFLAVWLKRAQYQYPRPFRAWLYTIALNRCRAVFRLKRPAPAPLGGQDAAGDDLSPIEGAISSEMAGLVSQAVTRLPPRQRAVVVLRVWHGLPYGEIADMVDCTEGTVRSHMHHALASLREPRRNIGIITFSSTVNSGSRKWN